MSKRKLEIQTQNSNWTCVLHPWAWKYFTLFPESSFTWPCAEWVCAEHTHSHMCESPGKPRHHAGYGNTGQFSLHPSSIPTVLAKALRDLSYDNEKLKCDGFNYNLYFHLTINYLPLIGGTSLSYDTGSGKILSPGGEQLGELNRAVHLPGTWAAAREGEGGCWAGRVGEEGLASGATQGWAGRYSQPVGAEGNKGIPPSSCPCACVCGSFPTL